MNCSRLISCSLSFSSISFDSILDCYKVLISSSLSRMLPYASDIILNIMSSVYFCLVLFSKKSLIFIWRYSSLDNSYNLFWLFDFDHDVKHLIFKSFRSHHEIQQSHLYIFIMICWVPSRISQGDSEGWPA